MTLSCFALVQGENSHMGIFLCFVSTSWCASRERRGHFLIHIQFFSYLFFLFFIFFSSKLEELDSQFGPESKNILILTLYPSASDYT